MIHPQREAMKKWEQDHPIPVSESLGEINFLVIVEGRLYLWITSATQHSRCPWTQSVKTVSHLSHFELPLTHRY